MRAGTVRQIGTPQEIYHEPADTFVARFVGSPPMNQCRTRTTYWGFGPSNFYRRAAKTEMAM